MRTDRDCFDDPADEQYSVSKPGLMQLEAERVYDEFEAHNGTKYYAERDKELDFDQIQDWGKDTDDE
jgi:hypothetical protein